MSDLVKSCKKYTIMLCDVMLTENTETTQTQKANNHTKIRNENKILQQQNKQLRDQNGSSSQIDRGAR